MSRPDGAMTKPVFGAVYMTVVEKIVDLNHDTRWVRLRLHEGSEIRFKAGQFIQFHVPPRDGRAEPVRRTYSIASSPSDTHAVELVVRRVPHGLCTTYIFEAMKEGDSITIKGPYGKFCLSGTDAEILFIAGGSGIAPILSMLQSMKESGIRRRATFYYGANTLSDLYWVERMRQFEKDLPDFAYVPCVARPAPEDKWAGVVGLVTEVLERRVADARNKEAYLCGSPGMIDAAIAVLHKKGFQDKDIFYDKFV